MSTIIMVNMIKPTTINRTIRMLPCTNRHILIAKRYFRCSTGALLELLLDAARITPIKGDHISDEIIDNFYKEINALSDADTYLLKD